MFSDLIVARGVCHIGEALPPDHAKTDDHHSPEDWKAFFHSMEHHTAFERRLIAPPRFRK